MLTVLQKLSGTIRRFAFHSGGNVAMLFAIAAIPLLLAAGTAIDYTRALRAQSRLQAAVDAAALSAAMEQTGELAKQKSAGAIYFKSNVENSELATAEPTISVDSEKVTVSADMSYPTSFMRLAGIDAMNISGHAEVALQKEDNVEIVLVLDYSGSMEKNSKYIRMRDAATGMVEQLTANAENSTVKFGLVPFSAMVRTSMPAEYVTQASAGPTWTGCTQDRKAPYNIGVSTPDPTNDDTKWGYIDTNGSENAVPKYDCPMYQTKRLDILPLTADVAAVQAKLAAMTPLGNTNIPLGAEFGWNLLDPAAPFSEGVSYEDDTTKKFLVLLTDGVQTSGHWGPKGNRSVDNGNDNLAKVCLGMAEKNITVFAIAFDIKAAAITKLLKDCAPGNYFEAEDDELSGVFEAITSRIEKSMLRLTR